MPVSEDKRPKVPDGGDVPNKRSARQRFMSNCVPTSPGRAAAMLGPDIVTFNHMPGT